MSDNDFHLFTAPEQSALRYNVNLGIGKGLIIRNRPRSLMTCHNCGRRGWAKHMRVRVYYDLTTVRCARGRGCRTKESAR